MTPPDITAVILRDLSALFSVGEAAEAVEAIHDPEALEASIRANTPRIEGELERILESATSDSHAAHLIAQLPTGEIQALFGYCLIAAGRLGSETQSAKEVHA